ncbi:hypothetical protein [Thermoplasma sp. Kam2015]|uniref:glycosyltransferase family 2 protein n=1 Tax=Thermoplasma sp. Kam2015 TaxID=2094122 RepID=UPI00137A58E1|nr:hypothetical protein [Thermoplasma sp. Kam2015]
MRIKSDRLVSNQGDKTISIIIPTPDTSDIRYKTAAAALREAADEVTGYDIYLTAVEDSGADFRYSRSVNRGIEEIHSDYYLNINDDVIVNRDTLIESIKLSERDPRTGIIGSILYYSDGEIQHAGMYVVKAPSLEYFWKMITYYQAPFDSVRKIMNYKAEGIFPFLLFMNSHTIGKPKHGLLTAAYHFIRGEVIDRITGYDENYRMGMEDMDFCLEVIRSGYHLSISRNIKAEHKETSHGINYSKQFGRETTKYFYSKWDVQQVLDLIDKNGMLYRFEG